MLRGFVIEQFLVLADDLATEGRLAQVLGVLSGSAAVCFTWRTASPSIQVSVEAIICISVLSKFVAISILLPILVTGARICV
ncbi:hypothetical protein Thiowin_00024 [Thiorhodovibrio winogradskyi]|uniref:Uncharacterized protein n=1 Tax=Thiorhodovibrio winogradskyi TaxID=77007 RepID=A0ABZ0S3J5_9GAMM